MKRFDYSDLNYLNIYYYNKLVLIKMDNNREREIRYVVKSFGNNGKYDMDLEMIDAAVERVLKMESLFGKTYRTNEIIEITNFGDYYDNLIAKKECEE